MMTEASIGDQVFAGMEMLAWTYEGYEWSDQLREREAFLRRRGDYGPAGYYGRDYALPIPRPPTVRLLDELRVRPWQHVHISTTGLVLRAAQRERAHLWRDARAPLTHVGLVDAGWMALVLQFAKLRPLVALPVPVALRRDVEEVADVLWQKTPKRSRGPRPRW